MFIQLKISIAHDSAIPLHLQVEKLLREMVKHPAYQQGELLPGETQLATILGISRNTIRQATNKLEYEGLLVRKKGIGTWVNKPTLTTQLDQWQSFTQEMNEQGLRLHVFEQNCEFVTPSVTLVNFFQLQGKQKVFCLKRLRGNEEEPFVYFQSYFHPRIGINENDDFSRPLYEILEKKYFVTPSLSREKIQALPAPPEIAKRLGIPPASPVLYRERMVYDPGERPVEFNTGYYRADRFTYSIDIRRR